MIPIEWREEIPENRRVFFRWIITQLQRLPPRSRGILLTCLYGVGAGMAAVAFQLAINWIYGATLESLSHDSLKVFLLGSFAVMMGASICAGFLMSSYCPDAAGSGVPQLKLAFWKDFGFVSLRAVWVKFVAGALTIGSGGSLGREGPSVYLAGGLASNEAGFLGEAKQRRRRAAAAGAAAGLAAAFNAPLAAITFVLEEIIEDLNSRWLGSVLLASVIGAFVVHGLIGKQPAFRLGSIDSPSFPVYVLIPVVAGIAALAGGAFQKLTLELRSRQKRMSKVPAWLRPSLGMAVVWALGVAVFATTGKMGVFSLGYDDLSAGLNNELPWKLAGILLFAKLAATVACYGFGGCGGIFSPTLFFGGMCGVFVGGLAGKVLHLSTADQMTLAVVGMSGCLGAVVRAPVTGILIVFEMTHEFSLVPALMLGALVSQAVGRSITKHNFYEELLLQDGHNLDRVIPPRDLQSWHELPLSAIANFQPVVVEDLTVDGLKKVLTAHPFQCFPVTREGKLAGMLTRKEAEAAVMGRRLPALEPAVVCSAGQTISELQKRLIDSATQVVVVTASSDGKILGLVTLHDLLRAQTTMARSTQE